MNPSTHKSVQRAATRAPLGIPIRLQADDSMEVLEGVCKNISIGGMFIQVDETRPQGSLLRFELPLDDGASVRGLGEVVWMRPKSAGPGVEAGIGIKFRFLEQQDRQLIFKLVSQYIKERLSKQGEARAQTPPPPVTAPGAVFRPPDPEPAPQAPRASAETAVESPSGSVPGATAGGSEGFTPPAPRSPAEIAASTPVPPATSTPLAPSPVDHGVGDSWDRPAEANDPHSELGSVEPYRPSDDLQRASPRRPRGLIVVLVGVVLFAVLGFLFRDRLFGPGAEPGEPAPAATTPSSGPAAGVAGAGPDSPGGGAVGGDVDPGGQGGEPTDLADPTSAAQTSSQQSSSQQGSTPVPPAEPSPTTDSTSSARPVAPPPSAAGTTTQPARRGYSNILGITWSETSDGLRVVFEGDGPIPEQRYRYFRLDGDPPREVIQFRGVENDFEPGSLTVGGPGVEQIRTGYHTKRNRPNELHVVMDMSSKGAKVSEFRSLGFTLEVLVTVESP